LKDGNNKIKDSRYSIKSSISDLSIQKIKDLKNDKKFMMNVSIRNEIKNKNKIKIKNG